MMEEKTLILAYDLQMFAKDGEGGEKTEPATPKKLEKARSEGQTAKSQDLNTAVLLFVLFACLRLFGGFMLDRIYAFFHFVYNTIGEYGKEEFNITRAEAVTIMSKVFGFVPDGTVSRFGDVTNSHWAFGYIED